MLVYTASKAQFNDDVMMNRISDIILEKLKENNIYNTGPAEYHSWQNSFPFMRNAIADPEIPDETEIAIEYQIPRTSKRVDFIISGADENDRDSVVVVELKQWEKAEKVDDEMHHSVRAYTGGAFRIVSHPSYQAYSYASVIKDYSEYVQDENILITPCAYLHNYQDQYVSELNDKIYKIWYDDAPFFTKTQVMELRNFIKKFISKKSKTGDLLYKINNGKIRPSKSLQDCLVSLIKGNNEFMLLDDQAVVCDMCKTIMSQCLKDGKKRTIIIQGGPGTGKSVLAINLLKDLIARGLNASYCTKNTAPRQSYLHLITKSDLKSKTAIKHLFRSPFGLSQSPSNFYDCLIVDEAHRLVKQMYRDYQGENQVKECINASLFSVFLIDEDQRITTKDIGSIAEIKEWAKKLGSYVICKEETVLQSQFRCNGSDYYIQWLNRMLQIGEPVDIDMSEMDFEIKVYDNPNEWRDALREKNAINNKARMVAGYCYDWNVKKNRGDYDIFLDDGFKAKWNLAEDNIWAINPNSFEEVGCIHTAQGLEFDYVGVIIGKDLGYDKNNGRIYTDKTKISRDDNTSGIRTTDDVTAEKLIKNTYKTLLTRGQKGCYIYCEDKDLREYIKSMLK